MKKFIYILTLVSITLSVSAQGIEQELLKADDAFRSFDFNKALKLYNKVAEMYPDNALIKEKIANIYMMPGTLNNKDMSLRYLEDAFKTGQMSQAMQLKYASLLQSQNSFEKAAQVYSNYNASSRTKNKLMSTANTAYYSTIANPADMIIKNLEDVNSANSDFSPMFYKDGIVFVSTRKNRSNTGFYNSNQIIQNYSDLFIAKLTDAKIQSFSLPTVFVENKDLKYMQGPVTFTDGYGVMYATRSFVEDNKTKALRSTEDNKTVLLEVFKMNYKFGDLNAWSETTPIVLNRGLGYQNYSYAHPAFVNGKGDEMIFASNMPGGYGGTDLYYTKMIGNEWSTPTNLGPEINTAGQEMFPYVGKDGVLYFASSGLPGLGGLDIFKASGSGSNYSGVQNMGAPLNTPFDDFGLILKEGNQEGYLTSNRPGGKGDDDIYYWKSSECNIKVRVYAALTNENLPNSEVKIPCYGDKSFITNAQGEVMIPCKDLKACDLAATSNGYNNKKMSLRSIGNAKVINVPMDKDYNDRIKLIVQVLDKETLQPICDANVVITQRSTSDASDGLTKCPNGIVRVSGVLANECYDIRAAKTSEKYLTVMDQVCLKGIKPGDSVVKVVYLTRAEVGKKFRIDNIYYDLDKWFIKPRAAQELDNIVNVMRENPTLEIELGSHTDCRATIKYNETLSGKRAASAVEYIVSRGIAASRLTSKGYGESELTNGCACEGTKKSTCTEDEHQANRRTEFKIIKF